MNKLNIKLIADSGSELSKEIIEKYDIEMLPMVITDGKNEYLDGVNITPQDVLKGMVNGVVYKTAQVPLKIFIEKFEKYAAIGQPIVCIVMSSGITSSKKAGETAKQIVLEKYPKADITVVDSKCCALGYGLLVMETAKYLETKAESKEDLLNYIEYLQKNIVHLWTVDKMEYLYRGGRISKTQVIISQALNIKPIFDVDPDGKLRLIGKARGSKNVAKFMKNKVRELVGDLDISTQTICISSGVYRDLMMEIKDFFEKEYNVKKFILQDIGSVVGAHTGPYMTTFYFFTAPLKA